MDAVIFCKRGRSTSSWDIAGAPMLVRQLEWLRRLGGARIAVEIDPSHAAWQALFAALDEHPIGAGVERVISAEPLGPAGVAARAGFGETPYLAISTAVLGDCSLGALVELGPGHKGMLRPIAGLEGCLGADVLLLDDAHPSIEAGVAIDGWGVLVRDRADANSLGAMALAREVPSIVVHAHEQRPGVWVARGAVISEEAKIHAPVFIGASAIINDGATIGPDVVIGARAIIEPRATVTDAIVEADTIVGEGVLLERCTAQGATIVDWATNARATIDDPLIVAPREGRSRSLLSSLVALCLLVVIAPLSLVLSPLRPMRDALIGLARGERCWIGVGASEDKGRDRSSLARMADSAPVGVFSIEQALYAPDATEEDRRRSRAWYALSKSASVDLRLLVGAARATRAQRFRNTKLQPT